MYLRDGILSKHRSTRLHTCPYTATGSVAYCYRPNTLTQRFSTFWDSITYKFCLSVADHRWKLCHGNLPKLVCLCSISSQNKKVTFSRGGPLVVRGARVENRCSNRSGTVGLYPHNQLQSIVRMKRIEGEVRTKEETRREQEGLVGHGGKSRIRAEEMWERRRRWSMKALWRRRTDDDKENRRKPKYVNKTKG